MDLFTEIARIEEDPNALLFDSIPQQETRFLLDRIESNPPLSTDHDLEQYLRLERDHRVHSCLQIRTAAVVNRPCRVIPGGDRPIDIEATEFVKSQLLGNEQAPQSGLLDRFTQPLYANGILLGFSVGELMWRRENGMTVLDDVLVRDSRSFVFRRLPNTPDDAAKHLGHELRFKSYNDPHLGVRLPDKKFFVWTFGSKQGNPYGVGLGAKLWWLVKLKRDSLKYWITYADKFGSPTAYGRIEDTEDYTAEELREIERRLLSFTGAIRRGTHGVLPKGTSLHLLESIRQGNVSYQNLTTYFDRAIAELILGTLQMGESQGLSGAPAANDEQARIEIVRSDADIFHSFLNATVVKWLTELNFPEARPPQIWRDFEENEDRQQLVERHKILFDIGYRLKPEAVARIYGDDFEPIESDDDSTAIALSEDLFESELARYYSSLASYAEIADASGYDELHLRRIAQEAGGGIRGRTAVLRTVIEDAYPRKK